jgi:hypothetical protein
MEIFIGLLLLALLAWGLRSRKKERTTWLKEERYEESGAWLDKRSGERGTFGSLDDEMEQERRSLRSQSNAKELSHLVRSYCLGAYPGFSSLADEPTQRCLGFIQKQAAAVVGAIEKMLETGAPPPPLSPPQADAPHCLALKKKVLDFSFDRFPKLLDLEIETIKKFDAWTEQIVASILAEIERQRILFPAPPPAAPSHKI